MSDNEGDAATRRRTAPEPRPSAHSRALSHPPQSPPSASDLVADELRERILSGDLRGGESLPTEQSLSAAMAVGRSSVREALRVLEAQGLIESVGRPLSRIVSPRGPVAPLRESMEALLRLKHVSARDLHSLRLALEVVAARTATTLEDPRNLEKMHAGLELMRDSLQDLDDFEAGDALFHVGILEAARNEAVNVLALVAADSVSEFVTEALHAKKRLTRTNLAQHHQKLVHDHNAILEAITERDADRATLLLIHHIEEQLS